MSIGRTGGPTAVPAGPQTPSAHQQMCGWFAPLESVAETTVSQTAPHHNGPPEVVIVATADATRESVLEAVRKRAESFPLRGVAPKVRPITSGERIRAPALAPDADIVAAVTMWQHPLTAAVEQVLTEHEAVADYEVSWSPDRDRLTIEPAVTPWQKIDALGVSVSFTPDADTDTTENVTQALQEAIVADRPEAYIAALSTERTPGDTLSGDGHDALFSLGFADRAAKADARSRIYHTGGESLPAVLDTTDLGEKQIQLTVTSPPYIDAIDYDAYAPEGEQDWTSFSMNDADVEAWMQSQREVFEAVYESTREGGYCAVVVGHIKRGENEWTPFPHHFAEVMESAGWTFHERIIWNKPTGGASRFGTTVQHPYPTYYYPNQQHEEIQVWRRGGVVNRRDEESRLAMTDLMKREIANNVWNIAPVPPNAGIDHPCPFPEELVHRLTLLYSCKGDVVADPMAGSGTTPKVADRLGRIGVGTELRGKYVATARRRLSVEPYQRRQQLVASYESVETCRNESEYRVSVADGGDEQPAGEESTPSQAGLGQFTE